MKRDVNEVKNTIGLHLLEHDFEKYNISFCLICLMVTYTQKSVSYFRRWYTISIFIPVFWGMTPCSLIGIYQHIGFTYRLRFAGNFLGLLLEPVDELLRITRCHIKQKIRVILSCVCGDYIRRVLGWQLDLLDHTQLHTYKRVSYSYNWLSQLSRNSCWVSSGPRTSCRPNWLLLAIN
jgi:hypothetical protein